MNSLYTVCACCPFVYQICHEKLTFWILLAKQVLNHRVPFASSIFLELEVHSLAHSALFEFDLQSFSQCLLAIHGEYRVLSLLRSFVTHEAIAFASTRLFVCHYAHTEYSSAVLFAEKIEQVHIRPLVRQVKYEKISARWTLFVLTCTYARHRLLLRM